MNTTVYVKSLQVFKVLMSETYHPTLVKIAVQCIAIMMAKEILPMITSAYREGDTGVHGYHRGLDFRTWDMSQDFIDRICEVINKHWAYDPDRPDKVCLMYHDVGRGPHLHLQVHPNTVRRCA